MRITPFLSLLLASLALVACGGSSSSDPSPATGPSNSSDPNATDASSFTSFCTSTSSTWDLEEKRIFESLTPSPAADYLALRHLEGGFDGPPKRSTITVAERGTRCASASNTSKCQSAYESLELQELFSNYLFYTRGDDAGIVRDVNGAMKLLGVVDSPAEAYFIAQLRGYHLSCSSEAVAGSRPVSGADGFDIVAEIGGCMSPVSRAVVRVHADGTVEELERRQIGPQGGCM